MFAERVEVPQVEQAVFPGVDPVLPRTPEEDSDGDQGGEEAYEDREQRDGDLAVVGLGGGVPVDERGRYQAEDDPLGGRHAGDLGMEVAQQLLQAKEVPGGLGRVRRLVDVGQLAEGSVD